MFQNVLHFFSCHTYHAKPFLLENYIIGTFWPFALGTALGMFCCEQFFCCEQDFVEKVT